MISVASSPCRRHPLHRSIAGIAYGCRCKAGNRSSSAGISRPGAREGLQPGAAIPPRRSMTAVLMAVRWVVQTTSRDSRSQHDRGRHYPDLHYRRHRTATLKTTPAIPSNAFLRVLCCVCAYLQSPASVSPHAATQAAVRGKGLTPLSWDFWDSQRELHAARWGATLAAAAGCALCTTAPTMLSALQEGPAAPLQGLSLQQLQGPTLQHGPLLQQGLAPQPSLGNVARLRTLTPHAAQTETRSRRLPCDVKHQPPRTRSA